MTDLICMYSINVRPIIYLFRVEGCYSGCRFPSRTGRLHWMVCRLCADIFKKFIKVNDLFAQYYYDEVSKVNPPHDKVEFIKY